MSINKHSDHYSKAEQQIIDDVKEYGFHVGLFEADDNEPSFGYTIGLWKTYNHPEIISFGLTTNTIAGIINNAGKKIQEGKSIELDVNDYDIFESGPAKFVSVDNERIAEYFGFAMWFNEYKEFPAIQLIWPDRQEKFPWEQDFEIEFQNKQPILNSKYSSMA